MRRSYGEIKVDEETSLSDDQHKVRMSWGGDTKNISRKSILKHLIIEECQTHTKYIYIFYIIRQWMDTGYTNYWVSGVQYLYFKLCMTLTNITFAIILIKQVSC